MSAAIALVRSFRSLMCHSHFLCHRVLGFLPEQQRISRKTICTIYFPWDLARFKLRCLLIAFLLHVTLPLSCSFDSASVLTVLFHDSAGFCGLAVVRREPDALVCLPLGADFLSHCWGRGREGGGFCGPRLSPPPLPMSQGALQGCVTTACGPVQQRPLGWGLSGGQCQAEVVL